MYWFRCDNNVLKLFNENKNSLLHDSGDVIRATAIGIY